MMMNLMIYEEMGSLDGGGGNSMLKGWSWIASMVGFMSQKCTEWNIEIDLYCYLVVSPTTRSRRSLHSKLLSLSFSLRTFLSLFALSLSLLRFLSFSLLTYKDCSDSLSNTYYAYDDDNISLITSSRIDARKSPSVSHLVNSWTWNKSTHPPAFDGVPPSVGSQSVSQSNSWIDLLSPPPPTFLLPPPCMYYVCMCVCVCVRPWKLSTAKKERERKKGLGWINARISRRGFLVSLSLASFTGREKEWMNG